MKQRGMNKMAQNPVERYTKLKKELEGLNRTFRTTREVKVNIKKIKDEITEDLKRELQGRSSYGIGI